VNKLSPGRQKGSRNRVPLELAQMIETALSKAGGVEYLVRQANENPVAFLALLGKILPRQVEVTRDTRLIVPPDWRALLQGPEPITAEAPRLDA
jgi:hypothetical protein